MERASNISVGAFNTTVSNNQTRNANDLTINEKTNEGVRLFVCATLALATLAALLAGWTPLSFSIVTVFLFAGPHNWFEFRYFLMRLPARLGRSRNFFLAAFAGLPLLALSYMSFPALYRFNVMSVGAWSTIIAAWNTALILWIALLVRLRAKQKTRSDWSWFPAVAFLLAALNWLAPELFSLAIVYVHPLVALVFLDRHLKRTRPAWLRAYRRCLCLLPLILAALWWRLANAPSLPDDNGLAWRITQHAGAELLPHVSSRLLVSTHVFLETLHYGVWLVALPLIGARGKIFDARSIPLVTHPHGFPSLIRAALAIGLFAVALLWLAFAADYNTTRDVYFTVAVAHVLAEVPFLLRMI